MRLKTLRLPVTAAMIGFAGSAQAAIITYDFTASGTGASSVISDRRCTFTAGRATCANVGNSAETGITLTGAFRIDTAKLPANLWSGIDGLAEYRGDPHVSGSSYDFLSTSMSVSGGARPVPAPSTAGASESWLYSYTDAFDGTGYLSLRSIDRPGDGVTREYDAQGHLIREVFIEISNVVQLNSVTAMSPVDGFVLPISFSLQNGGTLHSSYSFTEFLYDGQGRKTAQRNWNKTAHAPLSGATITLPNSVPEPPTLSFIGLSLLSLAVLRRRPTRA